MCTSGWSQMIHPKASPFARIEQEVGLTKVTVEYSRPAARGRTLFGTQSNGNPGLVPYGRIWRVGANESTKVNFDSDVYIQENLLPKGTYALYAFPEEESWEIVFHKNTSHWGDGRTAYDAKEDALRIKAIPIHTLRFQENFLIFFDELSHEGAKLILSWGATKISIPFRVTTGLQMEAQIKSKLGDTPTAQTYYEIARYYQEQGKKQEIALSYVNTAIEMQGSTYYFQRVKSLILADIGKYANAIAAAQLSLELAEKEGKDEFVRMNEANIQRWKEILLIPN